ncbi:MAG: TonB-dependent receptor plug domain-containing protein [Bacteroidota bacterium]
MTKFWAIFLFTSCCVPLRLWAQQSLGGLVVDGETGMPLPGAHIRCLQHWEIGTATQVDGSFTLHYEGSAPTDSIYFSFVGYQDTILSVGTLLAHHKVPLRPSVVVSEAVAVVAERFVAEDYSIKKINRLDIYQNPNAKADPVLAVNSLPSSTTTDESANVSFRGSSPSETGLFFNQVPVYDYVRFSQLNGIGTFSLFNTDMVQSVQVFPGNPPLEFGNTASGLIAIQTTWNQPEAAEYQFSASPASFGLSTRQKLGEKQGLHVYANYQPSFLLKAINPNALEDIPRFQSYDVGLHYTHALSDKTSLKVFQYFLRERYTFQFRSPSFSGPLEQRRFRSLSIGNLNHQLGPGRLSANVGVAGSKASFAYSQFSFQPEGVDYYASLNYHLELPKTGLKGGITYDRRTNRFYGRVPTFAFAMGEDHPFIDQNSRGDRAVLEGYFSLSHQVTDRWRAGLAIRKNIPNTQQESYWSYQINTNADLSDVLNLKLAYGRYHQVLLASERFRDNELLTTSQISADLTLKLKGHQSILSVFMKDRKVVGEQEEIFGVELAQEGSLNRQLEYSFSYTYLNADLRRGEENLRGPFDLSYFARAALSWQPLDNWNIGARMLARQGVNYRPIDGADWNPTLQVFEPPASTRQDRLPAYKNIDLSLSYLCGLTERTAAVFFANVSNIFDWQNARGPVYAEDYSFDDYSRFARRIFYFGVVINWHGE